MELYHSLESVKALSCCYRDLLSCKIAHTFLLKKYIYIFLYNYYLISTTCIIVAILLSVVFARISKIAISFVQQIYIDDRYKVFLYTYS